PGAADHATEILGVHAQLQHLAASGVDRAHPDVLRVVDDALDEVLERGGEHVRPGRTRRPAPRPGPPRRSRGPRPEPRQPPPREPRRPRPGPPRRARPAPPPPRPSSPTWA